MTFRSTWILYLSHDFFLTLEWICHINICYFCIFGKNVENSLTCRRKNNRYVASLSNLRTGRSYLCEAHVPRRVGTSFVMLVSTKRRVFQRRVLHATRWKNESKYRARGAGGPDKIKQLFPRFIGSAVNRRDRRPREPLLPRNAFFSGCVSTRVQYPQ